MSDPSRNRRMKTLALSLAAGMLAAAAAAAETGFSPAGLERLFSGAAGASVDISFRGIAPEGLTLAAKQPKKADLESVLDRVLRSTMLLTVGEVKPFSGELDNDLQANEILLAAVRDGRITNPDIKFYLLKAHPDGSNFDTTIMNRKAAARLSRDQGVIAMLGKYSIPVPAEAEGWESLFNKAVMADGYAETGPFWANLVIGISLGYPPLECEMYSKEGANGTHPRRTVGGRGRDGFAISGYARFTELEKERDRYYVLSTNLLMDNYERLRKSGRSALEIINDPEGLKAGLPAFPEAFLEPAAEASPR